MKVSEVNHFNKLYGCHLKRVWLFCVFRDLSHIGHHVPLHQTPKINCIEGYPGYRLDGNDEFNNPDFNFYRALF